MLDRWHHPRSLRVGKWKSICFLGLLLTVFYSNSVEAQSVFSWPTDTGISQEYGKRDDLTTADVPTLSDSYKGGKNFHTGIDFGRDHSRSKTPVRAIADGVVAEIYGLAGSGGVATSENMPLWNDANGDHILQDAETIEAPFSTGKSRYNPEGVMVVIRHSSGKFSLYGHLGGVRKDIYQRFANGETVSINRGEEIAVMGGSGGKLTNAFAVHLHL